MATDRHIFFDLDHTLWDFERNSAETIDDLLKQFSSEIGAKMDSAEFLPVYYRHNTYLWRQYRENKVDMPTLRRLRWEWTFDELKMPEGAWRAELDGAYMAICPTQPHLMPNCIALLDQLRGKYQLHIVTNGFAETQAVKLAKSGLGDYMDVVVTPEDTGGLKKPRREIFELALERSGADRDSLYIGDHYEADVRGSRKAGMRPVFYNPQKVNNPDRAAEISDLLHLLDLL